MVENKILKWELNIPLTIILNSFLSFIISYFLSVIYLWLYQKADKNNRFESKIVEKLNLK